MGEEKLLNNEGHSRRHPSWDVSGTFTREGPAEGPIAVVYVQFWIASRSRGFGVRWFKVFLGGPRFGATEHGDGRTWRDIGPARGRNPVAQTEIYRLVFEGTKGYFGDPQKVARPFTPQGS